MLLQYITIGIIIQAIIVVERAIRFPEIWTEGYSHLWFWIGFVTTAIYNVMAWPVTIVAETYNIYKNQ